MRAIFLTTTLFVAACSTMEPSGSDKPGDTRRESVVEPADFMVTALLETPITDSLGDSADDPAIYIDGENGFILGSDKQRGIYVYNLDGTQRAFLETGPVNNVDLREGFGGDVLIVASDDEEGAIVALTYSPLTDSFSAPSRISTPGIEPYGICLGKVGETFHAGATTKAGIYYQYAIARGADGITGTAVREFPTGTKTEGCVFDDRTQTLYIAEEMGGLYSYPAVGPAPQTVIMREGEHGTRGDLEGVTLYPEGTDGGYLVLSSQGNNSYAVFSLPGAKFVSRFGIADGMLDGTSTTDGIAATAVPTARFPQGFLVVQDDHDDSFTPTGIEEIDDEVKRQNFKIVDWREIAKGL